MKRKFDVKLRKVGNSYVATIPKDTIDRFELQEGDYIALTFDSSDTEKSFKPSPKGDRQSKALSSFSCPKKSLNKTAPLDVDKTQGFSDIKNLNKKEMKKDEKNI